MMPYDEDDLTYARLRHWMDQDDDAFASLAAMDRLLERRYGNADDDDDKGARSDR